MGDDRAGGVFGSFGGIGQRHQVIGDNVAGLVEPEGGHPVEDGALVRDGRGQDDIKGGDAVGGDHQQQVVGEAVGVADFAAMQAVGDAGFGNHKRAVSGRVGGRWLVAGGLVTGG